MSDNQVADKDDKNLDYQVGAHSVDNRKVALGDDSEFLEWEMEVPTVFKRLADDIYTSAEAGIREPLTNAVTAVLNAEREFDMDETGRINFELRLVNDDLVLTIRDNGTGIRELELREVLRYIGRSTTRDDGNLAGRFGMGFLAVFKLVGVDSGFTMHTHHRDPDEEPISGVWRSGGFSFDNEGILDGNLSGDEYGTKFEFVLEEIDNPDVIRGWVENNAEFARVPVSYREIENGKVTFEKNYDGSGGFEKNYPNDSPSVTIENEYYRASMSSEASSKTILLDVPVERNKYRLASELPFGKVDVRLKNENGVVVEGPHEGLMPVDEGEYASMDAERKKDFVSRNELNENDICLPSPTGTRDTLGPQRDFWDSHFVPRLREKYDSIVTDAFSTLDEPSDLLALPKRDFLLIMNAVNFCKESSAPRSRRRRKNYNYTLKKLQRDLDNEFDTQLDDNVAEFLLIYNVEVVVIEPDSSTKNQSHSNKSQKPAWRADFNSSADVYMGVSINDTKAKAIRTANPENKIVRLESTEHYDSFENHLGWKKVRGITTRGLEDLNLSEDEKKRFKRELGSSSKIKAASKDLTIHFDDGRRSSNYSATARDLKKKFDECDFDNGETPNLGLTSVRSPEKLVVFPTSSDHNISDYYYMGSSRVGIARCSNKTAEILTQNDRIMTIDTCMQEARNTEIKTNKGVMKIGANLKYLVLHYLSPEFVDVFRQKDILEAVPNYLAEIGKDSYSMPELEADEIIYAPVTKDDIIKIRPLIKSRTPRILVGDNRLTSTGNSIRRSSDTQIYAHALLNDESTKIKSKELKFFMETEISLAEGGYEVVNAVAEKQLKY